MPILVLKDKRYEFDVAQFTNKEAMAVEKATGYPWQEWIDKINEGDVLATTGLVWMVRRKAQEDVAFHDVDFAMGDVSFDLDDEQKRAVEAAVAAAEAAEGEENPTQQESPATGGGGPEASPRPRPSTSSRSRRSSGSTSGTTTG